MSVSADLDPTATIVGGSHYLFVGPSGTALPTDVGTAPGDGLDAAFLHCGYTADSGSSFKVDTQSTDLYASQSYDPIRTIIQSRKATITAPLIEWNAASIVTAFGGGEITGTSNGSKYTPPAAGTIEEVSAVLDIVDGAELTRIVIERAIIVGSVEGSFNKTSFATLPITLNALAPVTLPTAWFLVGTNAALGTGS